MISMSKSESEQLTNINKYFNENKEIFIDGYLTQRLLKGFRPDYSEPRNTLSYIDPDFEMEFIPSFMEAFKKET